MKRNRNIKQYDKRNSDVYNYHNMICIPSSNYSTLCSPWPSFHFTTLIDTSFPFEFTLFHFTSQPFCVYESRNWIQTPRSTGSPQKHRTSPETPDIPRSTGPPQKHRTSPEAPDIARSTGYPQKHLTMTLLFTGCGKCATFENYGQVIVGGGGMFNGKSVQVIQSFGKNKELEVIFSEAVVECWEVVSCLAFFGGNEDSVYNSSHYARSSIQSSNPALLG